MSDLSSIGRYDLLELVAAGRLAEVFTAVDPRAGCRVILKLCTAADEILRREFLAQAELNAGLEHSHIVPVLDLGREDGLPWLVEEDPAGESFAELIGRGTPVPELRRLDDLLQVAVALEHAHAQGVLHRGLTAETVWRSSHGEVRVTDFGLTRFVGSGDRLLAPEQVLDRAPDARSDVFCFGALAFELLTGEVPFPGDEPSVRAARLLEGRPASLKAIWPACPADLANLVDRCLKSAPERRPQEMVEIVSELGFIVASPRAETFPALDLAEAGAQDAVPEGRGGDSSGRVAAGPRVADPAAATSGARAAAPVREPTRGGAGRIAALLAVAGRAAAACGRLVASAGRRLGPLAVRGLEALRRGLGRLSPRHQVAIGLGVLVVILAVLWWAGSGPSSGSGEAAPSGSVTGQASAGTVPALEPVALTGRLVVDSRPWGRILDLSGPAGAVALSAGQRTTPVALDLPPGEYRVALGHPDVAEPVVCVANVPALGRAVCEPTLAEPRGADYFRAGGWWR